MSSGVNQDGEIPKKKASRFNIVSSSDDAGLPLKSAQPNIQRTASTAGLAATGEQTPPPIKGRLEAVLPHLEAMLKVLEG